MTDKIIEPKPNLFHGNPKGEQLPYEDGSRSLINIFKCLRVGLILFVPLAAILAAHTALLLTFPNAYVAFLLSQITEGTSVWSYGLIWLSLVYRVVYVVGIFLSAWLLFRATRNLHTVVPGRLITTPHWAWLWFFIPFTNFYKPYKAVSEIDLETRRASGISQQSNPLIKAWWICFILSVFLGATDVTLPIPNLAQILLAFEIVSGVLGIIAAILFLQITRDLANHQEFLKAAGAAQVFA